jgi:hypothetical protein
LYNFKLKICQERIEITTEKKIQIKHNNKIMFNNN